MPKGLDGFQKGNQYGKKNKGKISPWKGIKNRYSKKTLRKMRKVKLGEQSHFWKGGVSLENEKIRKSLEYRLWVKAVFERDNYQCIWGGKKHGSKLHADHIKPFALYPELRFAIDNGRTLCVDCHKKTYTYGFNKRYIKNADYCEHGLVRRFCQKCKHTVPAYQNGKK